MNYKFIKTNKIIFPLYNPNFKINNTSKIVDLFVNKIPILYDGTIIYSHENKIDNDNKIIIGWVEGNATVKDNLIYADVIIQTDYSKTMFTNYECQIDEKYNIIKIVCIYFE